MELYLLMLLGAFNVVDVGTKRQMGTMDTCRPQMM